MNIGVLKEIKHHEQRAALQPRQVRELVEKGHEVWLEATSGNECQYPDQVYQEAGALIGNKNQVLDSSELILKVKCPLPSEYGDYGKDHCLFTYLHFDENIPPDNIHKLISSGFLGIAYEWVGTPGYYPLLNPMSKVTGHLFFQRSVELLAKHKGVLAGTLHGSKSGANILIMGLGNIGTEVLKGALLNGLNVFVMVKNPDDAIRKTQEIFTKAFGVVPNNLLPTIIPFDNENPDVCKERIRELMPELDIIINCAVRRPELPKSKLDYLIDRTMIKTMQPNSVVCDATACDKDFIETCISSDDLNHYDVVDGVIHYSPDHIPSYTPKTATDLLTDSTFDYVKLLADLGAKEAIKTNKELRNGVSCFEGEITHLYTAEKKQLNYVDILSLLKDA